MSEEFKLNHTVCPLCSADDVTFHGDREDHNCGGCHVIVCNTCDAGFDLVHSAGANSCTTLDEVKARISARWNNYREPNPVALPAAKGLH